MRSAEPAVPARGLRADSPLPGGILNRVPARRLSHSAAPAPIVAGSILALAVVGLAVPAPAAGQDMTRAQAVVRVPPVSQLSVVPQGETEVAPGQEGEGVLEVRVRSNHAWRVLLSTSADAGVDVWVRELTESGSGEFRRLQPGVETAVAAGDRGDRTVRLEYRVAREGVAGDLPVLCTLATL